VPLGRVEGMDVLFNVYDEYFPKDYPLRWFDLELRRMTGVDVYAHIFSKEQGFVRISEGKYDVLVLTAEKLKGNGGVVGSFVGDPEFSFISKNDGSKKWYAAIYKEFVRAHRPSKDELNMYRSSKFFKHFYN